MITFLSENLIHFYFAFLLVGFGWAASKVAAG